MELTIANLCAHYGGSDVLSNINARVASGMLLTVVGPSGSGKSTLLRALAGLAPPFVSGDINFNGRNVIQESPRKRNVGFVFQDLALYPHMRIYDSIALALRFTTNATRLEPKALKEHIRSVAKRLDIDDLLERFPNQLSGGQQQRAAIARAIVRVPHLNLLLLDEPFSGLDRMLRATIRSLVRSLNRELGVTTVCVTHDRFDALNISDLILVLRAGHTQQLDTPSNILDRPANFFVASFISEAPLNSYPVKVDQEGRLALRFGGMELPLLPATADLLRQMENVTISFRPESVFEAQECGDPTPHLHHVMLNIVGSELFDDRILVEARTPNGDTLRFLKSRRSLMSTDTPTAVCIAARDLFAFSASGARIEL